MRMRMEQSRCATMKDYVVKRYLRQFGRGEEGSALVLIVVAVAMLMLVAGLGVDVGYLRYQKQQMQKAADAGALAGASAKVYGGIVDTAAKNDTKANGFENGQSGITVTVNDPPQSGPFSGQSGFVEVIVAQAQPTFFMKVAGFNQVAVSSRAIASALGDASGCIFAMDPSSARALQVDGHVTVNSGCGIQVESNNGDALDVNGNSAKVIASDIGVVGGVNAKDGTLIPQAVTGIARFQDPFANVPAPPVDNAPCKTPSGNHYTPGTYCSPISISGNGTYQFDAGVYTISGMSVAGNATLNGSNVQFHLMPVNGNSYSGIDIRGTATLNFTAPTTGSQAGILFYQDRSVTVGSSGSRFIGTSSPNFKGSLYFPTTGLTFSGTPNVINDAILVGYTIEFNGDVQLRNNLLQGGGSPIKSALLVE